MLRRFIGAVLPSMLAFAFSGLYTIVDGFFRLVFVGRLRGKAISY